MKDFFSSKRSRFLAKTVLGDGKIMRFYIGRDMNDF
jgi:hypothetical protein